VGPFGYCTDALGDLVRAALMLVSSGCRTEVTFDGEPREWRLIFETDWKLGSSGKNLDIRLKTFPDVCLASPEADGLLLVEAETTADEFGRAVELAARSIWDRYGVDGYNRAWNPTLNSFPLRALNALSTALSVEEPPLPAEHSS
jgi:hypothetical protein